MANVWKEAALHEFRRLEEVAETVRQQHPEYNLRTPGAAFRLPPTAHTAAHYAWEFVNALELARSVRASRCLDALTAAAFWLGKFRAVEK